MSGRARGGWKSVFPGVGGCTEDVYASRWTRGRARPGRRKLHPLVAARADVVNTRRLIAQTNDGRFGVNRFRPGELPQTRVALSLSLLLSLAVATRSTRHGTSRASLECGRDHRDIPCVIGKER